MCFDTQLYIVKIIQFFVSRNSQLFDILVMDAIYAKQGTVDLEHFQQRVRQMHAHIPPRAHARTKQRRSLKWNIPLFF